MTVWMGKRVENRLQPYGPTIVWPNGPKVKRLICPKVGQKDKSYIGITSLTPNCPSRIYSSINAQIAHQTHPILNTIVTVKHFILNG